MKTFTTSLAALLLTCAAAPSALAQEEFTPQTKVEGSLLFTTLSESTAKVEYADHQTDILETEITIPASVEINGTTYAVTEVADYAFRVTAEGCVNQLAKINLPEGLLRIGDRSFIYSQLETLVIPNSVTEVADFAFGGTKYLKEITIGSGVKSLGENAFAGSGPAWSAVNITVLATEPPVIAFSTFQNYSWAKLYVPKGSLEAYQNDANWGRFKSISEIGGSDEPDTPVDPEDPEEPTFTEVSATINGLLYTSISDGTVKVEIADKSADFDTESLVIPATITIDEVEYTVTEVADNGFVLVSSNYVNFMNAVEFPLTLKRIGEKAFERVKLTEVRIPDSVTEIGSLAFANSQTITKIVIGSGLTSLPADCFKGATAFFSSYRVEVRATVPPTIGDRTFDMPNFATLVVPEGCTEVYKAADYWKNFGTIIESSECSTIDVEANAIASIEYFTLTGARIATPSLGTTCIKVVTTSDGRHQASKIVVK